MSTKNNINIFKKVVDPPPVGPRNGMEWNKLLGLSASLLAGGAAWIMDTQKLLPGPGQSNPASKYQKYGTLSRQHFPTGWRAIPVCAMQEPIPDLLLF